MADVKEALDRTANMFRGVVTKTIFETSGPLNPPQGHRPEIDDYGAPNLGEDDITGAVELGAAFSGVHMLISLTGKASNLPKSTGKPTVPSTTDCMGTILDHSQTMLTGNIHNGIHINK